MYHIEKQQKKKNFTKIPCKYCNATILQYHEQKHFKKCSTKLQQDRIKNQPFYHENIHYHGDHSNYQQNKQTPNLTEQEFISKLLSKYNSIKHTLTPIQQSKIDSFPAIQSIYLNTHKNKKKLKHCKQIELIIYHIHNIIKSLQLSSNYFLFELGAGKGGLGSMFHRFLQKFLLIVDINSKYKTKEDSRLNLNAKKRIQCGLQHLDLDKMDLAEMKDIDNECIVFSKHLCGAATDFGLRCIINNNNDRFKAKCIGIALCCRTLCSFDTYCNIEYLMDIVGVIDNENEWNYIRKMTHWGIDHQNDEKRNEIGMICRRLIDEGRVRYLKKNGFVNVKLIEYCDKSVTLENILLLAS